MRSRFLAIFSLLAALSFAGSVRTAAAVEIPCFCRYGSSHADFQTSSDAQRFCPNEVYYWGLIDAESTTEASADCGARCGSDGTTFVATSSWTDEVTAGEAVYGNPANMLTDEENQCIFTAFNSLQRPPAHWEPGYAGCYEPLNSKAGESWPQACSFCFCKFKAGPGQNAACAGKTTMVKATSYPAKCESLCTTLNLDPVGPGVESYNDHCDYRARDNCAAPVATSGACATELGAQASTEAAQQATASFYAKTGSALGQLIPLGDISLPQVIARIIRTLLGVVGALALVFFLWGGFRYMTAAGDESKVKSARDMIVAAVSGLAAIFLSYAVLSLLINALT